MSFCYSNNGQSMRAVDLDYQPTVGEAVFDHYASDDELIVAFPVYATERQRSATAESNATIKAQLADLDAKSVRALHEAVLAMAASGVSLPDDTISRLQTIETEKQSLRAQLR